MKVHLQHLYGGIRVPLRTDNEKIRAPVTIHARWAACREQT